MQKRRRTRAFLAEVEAEEAKHSGDPLEYLSPSELAAAQVRDVWAKMDAQTLSLADLAARVSVAVARNDRPGAALWLRYGTRRLEAERSAAIERGEYLQHSGSVALLSEQLTKAESVLIDEAALARRKVLAERRQAAETVRESARYARRDVDPEERAALARRFGLRGK